MARSPVRRSSSPPAGGRLSDARIAQRGGRRGPGRVAPARPCGHERGRQPRRLADDLVARVALNMLRARNTRHEQPLDVRVPDPIVDPADGTDPEHEALLADSVGLALLVVLETLTPAERLAFVLHDMFAVPFDEIAPIVERSPEATRQLASRARRRVRGADPSRTLDRGPAGGRRRVPRRRAGRRLRRARRGARPRRRAQGRRRPRRRPLGTRPGGGERRRPGALLVSRRPDAAAGAHQRRRRDGRLPRRPAVLDRRLHDQEREDRRDRLPRRPGTDRTARPVRARR